MIINIINLNIIDKKLFSYLLIIDQNMKIIVCLLVSVTILIFV